MCINTDTPASNPFLQSWSSEPFHLPPFQTIKPSHFKEAFEKGMEEHLADLRAIVNNEQEPNFENTIAAYDRAGSLLSKISSVFSNMCSSLNTDELKEVQTEMVPILSRHGSSTYVLPGLFDRIDAVHQKQLEADTDNLLSPEQIRLIERFHLDFSRQGANFDEEEKEEYADLKAKLASLQTEFAQNVMKDEETFEIVLSKDDMAGCPESLVEAARQAAIERTKGEDDYVITLSRSLVEPFLTYSSRRDLREKVWREWSRRGELSEDRANLPIAVEMLKLRKRQAEMHGCKSFAEYQCRDLMAKTPENVMELLENVWERAKNCANKEREALEAYCEEIGDDLGEEGVEPWDWRYYAEKVRISKYDFDESIFRPYLSLEKVTEAVMAVSNKLFGLTYVKRDDITSYHPDVNTYEVHETAEDGTDKLVAIFIHDNYARKFKSSGAWMSEYRGQTKNLEPGADSMEGVPIISNNNNFAKGSGPTLLSFDDATTLFHEMGHGHHGMLSDATYARLAGTNVLTDFVELPSQLMEHWLEQPEVLKEYARHYETNEPVPDEMLAKLKAAKSFNQGFETIEYTSCALLDMALHQVENYDDFDISKFEKEELARLGMPKGIIMRHRPAHFQHLFASSHYAAGYYVYLWAEVLDADVFAAFKETGNVFDEATAKKARKYIYSSGNTVAPDELFRLFRGRDPEIKYMLEKKGLTGGAN
jgi:peptidyl-dipeptidase Dcp